MIGIARIRKRFLEYLGTIQGGVGVVVPSFDVAEQERRQKQRELEMLAGVLGLGKEEVVGAVKKSEVFDLSFDRLRRMTPAFMTVKVSGGTERKRRFELQTGKSGHMLEVDVVVDGDFSDRVVRVYKANEGKMVAVVRSDKVRVERWVWGKKKMIEATKVGFDGKADDKWRLVMVVIEKAAGDVDRGVLPEECYVVRQLGGDYWEEAQLVEYDF